MIDQIDQYICKFLLFFYNTFINSISSILPLNIRLESIHSSSIYFLIYEPVRIAENILSQMHNHHSSDYLFYFHFHLFVIYSIFLMECLDLSHMFLITLLHLLIDELQLSLLFDSLYYYHYLCIFHFLSCGLESNAIYDSIQCRDRT